MDTQAHLLTSERRQRISCFPNNCAVPPQPANWPNELSGNFLFGLRIEFLAAMSHIAKLIKCSLKPISRWLGGFLPPCHELQNQWAFQHRVSIFLKEWNLSVKLGGKEQEILTTHSFHASSFRCRPFKFVSTCHWQCVYIILRISSAHAHFTQWNTWRTCSKNLKTLVLKWSKKCNRKARRF